MTRTEAALLTRRLPLASRPLMVLAGSGLLALSAQVSLPMWPVPMSMQPFAVLLIGLSCGARLGAGAVLAYLAEAALGLPVLAGGHALLPLGPSAGYLLGFLLAATATGALADRGWTRRPGLLALALLAGLALDYLPGLLWLDLAWLHDWRATLAAGAAPFLLGDLVKAALVGAAIAGAERVGRAGR